MSDRVNPYASPASDAIAEDESDQRAAVSRSFRRLGWGTIVFITIRCGIEFIVLFATRADRADTHGTIIGFCLQTAFVCSLLVIAGRLDADFRRWHRTARWLAILTAIFFGPFLTIPSILTIRRLAAYRKRFEASTA